MVFVKRAYRGSTGAYAWRDIEGGTGGRGRGYALGKFPPPNYPRKTFFKKISIPPCVVLINMIKYWRNL